MTNDTAMAIEDYSINLVPFTPKSRKRPNTKSPTGITRDSLLAEYCHNNPRYQGYDGHSGLDRLQHADLSNLNLDGLNLSGINFDFAILANTSMVGCLLSDSKLSNTNMMGANLTKSVLENCDLTGAMVDNANFQDCKLTFSYLDFESYEGANFSGADLWVSHIHERFIEHFNNFDHPSFTNANLSEIRVIKAGE